MAWLTSYGCESATFETRDDQESVETIDVRIDDDAIDVFDSADPNDDSADGTDLNDGDSEECTIYPCEEGGHIAHTHSPLPDSCQAPK